MEREQYQREIIVRLFQTSNALQTYMDKLLKKDHVTTKQFFMMIILGSFETPPRIGEISDRFGTSRQNAKQVLLKLEKNGFVELFKDEQDSRVTRVRFTEKSNLFWGNREDMDNQIIGTLFENLSIDELAHTQVSLVKLFATIESLKEQL